MALNVRLMTASAKAAAHKPVDARAEYLHQAAVEIFIAVAGLTNEVDKCFILQVWRLPQPFRWVAGQHAADFGFDSCGPLV